MKKAGVVLYLLSMGVRAGAVLVTRFVAPPHVGRLLMTDGVLVLSLAGRHGVGQWLMAGSIVVLAFLALVSVGDCGAFKFSPPASRIIAVQAFFAAIGALRGRKAI